MTYSISGGGGGATLTFARRWADFPLPVMEPVADGCERHGVGWMNAGEHLAKEMTNTESVMGWRSAAAQAATMNAYEKQEIAQVVYQAVRAVAAEVVEFVNIVRGAQARLQDLLTQHEQMTAKLRHQEANVAKAAAMQAENPDGPGMDHIQQDELARLRNIQDHLEMLEQGLRVGTATCDGAVEELAARVQAATRNVATVADPRESGVVSLGVVVPPGVAALFAAAGMAPSPQMEWALERFAKLGDEDDRLGRLRLIVGALPPDQRELFLQGVPDAAAELAGVRDFDRVLAGDFPPGSAELTFFGAMRDSGVAFDVQQSGQVPEQIRTVQAAWAKLSPEQQHYLAHAYPGVVGNLRGVPPKMRYAANRVAILGAKTTHRRMAEILDRMPHATWQGDVKVGQLVGRLEQDPLLRRANATEGMVDWLFKERAKPPQRPEDNASADKWLVNSDGVSQYFKDRERDYGSFLEQRFEQNPDGNRRQFLMFNPVRDGEAVEVLGTLDKHTKNVGTFVPGTKTNIGKLNEYTESGKFLLGGNDPTQNAQLVFLGGDFPSELTDAPKREYARFTGRNLAAQQAEVGMLAENAQLTVAGHSYGGAIVGKAEQYGMPADHVVHLSSAGIGAGEDEPNGEYVDHWDDYPERDILGRAKHPTDTEPGTQRWSHTPPGDAIIAAQELGDLVPGVGHGPDPDQFPGVNVLPPSQYLNGFENANLVGKEVSAFGGGQNPVSVHGNSAKPYTGTLQQISDISFGEKPVNYTHIPYGSEPYKKKIEQFFELYAESQKYHPMPYGYR